MGPIRPFIIFDVSIHSDWSAICNFCGPVDDSFFFFLLIFFSYLSSSFLEFGFKDFIVFKICLSCLKKGSVLFIFYFFIFERFLKVTENRLLHDLILSK